MTGSGARLSVAIEIRVGSRNEDRAAFYSDGEYSVFVLADGAGGVGGGALAAEIVLQEAQSFYQGRHRCAVAALQAADRRIELLGSLSTGVIVELRSGQLSGASCGDSKAWLIGNDGVLDLTSAQVRKPLLGGGAISVAFGPEVFKGRLLLASDGLMNYAPVSAITRAAMNSGVEESAKRLAELPRLKSAAFPDDVAILLAECG